jgi:PRTRC genetic system protein E
MSLFTKLAPLVQAGAVVHLTLRQSGNLMQLEILPAIDAGKTGITVPARAFQASPEELDREIPGFLDHYVAGAVNLSDQIAVTVAVMDRAIEDAKDAAKKAQTAKAVSPTRGKSQVATKPAKARNDNAGFLEDDSEEDPEDDDQPVTPSTSASAASNPGLVVEDSLF